MTWKKLFNLFRSRPVAGRFVGRARTCDDTAIKYRMGAGSAGDVTRLVGAAIEPCFPDSTNPPTFYGQPVVVDATSHLVRALLATDNAADAIYGITVRPYPTQQATASNAFGAIALGAATPSTTTEIGVLRRGYILVPLNGVTGAVKGGRVYVWTAAVASGHTAVGGFEIAACSQKTIVLDEHSFYNGVEDSNKLVEIGFNI